MRHTVEPRSALLTAFAIATALLLVWATIPVATATAMGAGTATGTPLPTASPTATPSVTAQVSPTATAVSPAAGSPTTAMSPTVAPTAAPATISPTVPVSPTTIVSPTATPNSSPTASPTTAPSPTAAPSATATVNPLLGTGSLVADITSDAPRAAAVLDGTDKVATYTVTIVVTDTRTLAAGWHLTLTSTTLSTGGASARRLSNTASRITDVRVSCAEGTSCTLPANSVNVAALALPAGAAAPAPVKFFNAAPNTGRGAMTITLTIGVEIPANAYAGTYAGTLTVAAVGGR